LKPRSH